MGFIDLYENKLNTLKDLDYDAKTGTISDKRGGRTKIKLTNTAKGESHAFFTHWYAESFSGITYKIKKNVQKTKKNKKNGKFYPQKFEYYNLMSYLCNG